LTRCASRKDRYLAEERSSEARFHEAMDRLIERTTAKHERLTQAACRAESTTAVTSRGSRKHFPFTLNKLPKVAGHEGNHRLGWARNALRYNLLEGKTICGHGPCLAACGVLHDKRPVQISLRRASAREESGTIADDIANGGNARRSTFTRIGFEGKTMNLRKLLLLLLFLLLLPFSLKVRGQDFDRHRSLPEDRDAHKVGTILTTLVSDQNRDSNEVEAEAEKSTEINPVVRIKDESADRMVDSYVITDAETTYTGKWNCSQRWCPGCFPRLINWIL